jgi:hypothetical protein
MIIISIKFVINAMTVMRVMAMFVELVTLLN